MKAFFVMGLMGMASLAAVAQADGFDTGFTRVAGFELSGSHTLKDVTSYFGEAPLVTEAKYNAMQASVCYKMSGGYLQFLSHDLAPDLATHQPMLMGVGMSESAPNKQCVAVAADKDLGALALNGLQPGMSMGDYKALTQGKTLTGDEMLSAVYVYPVGNLQGRVDVIPEFSRGKMDSVQVWKTLMR